MSYRVVRKGKRGFFYEYPVDAETAMINIEGDMDNMDYRIYLAEMMPPAFARSEVDETGLNLILKYAPMLEVPEGRARESGQFLFSLLAERHREELEEMLDKEPAIRDFFLEMTLRQQKAVDQYWGSPVAVISETDDLMMPSEWRTVKAGAETIYTRLTDDEIEELKASYKEYLEKFANAPAA